MCKPFPVLFLSILCIQCTHQPVQRAPNSTSKELLEFTIEAPFTSMAKDFDKKEFVGLIRNGTDSVIADVRFEGAGRRGKCKFPNLRVEVKKKKTDEVKALSKRSIGLLATKNK